mgnify:FL=1
MLNKLPRLNKYIRRYWILICTFSLICTLIVSNQPSYSLTVQDVPNPRQQNGSWVTDMVDMLSPQAETQLNQMISELENQNGTAIAIVTVPETKPSSTPKKFTTELFNTWGIGKKGQDNGILFLISKGDRRTEIKTGKGIEGILTDAKVINILREQVTPKFKKGNFEAGIIAGTKALIQELGTDGSGADNSNINSLESNNEVPEQSEDTINDFIWGIFWSFISALLIGLFTLISSVKDFVNLLSGKSSRRSFWDSSSSNDYSSYSSSDESSSSSDFGGGESDGGGGGDGW